MSNKIKTFAEVTEYINRPHTKDELNVEMAYLLHELCLEGAMEAGNVGNILSVLTAMTEVATEFRTMFGNEPTVSDELPISS